MVQKAFKPSARKALKKYRAKNPKGPLPKSMQKRARQGKLSYEVGGPFNNKGKSMPKIPPGAAKKTAEAGKMAISPMSHVHRTLRKYLKD